MPEEKNRRSLTSLIAGIRFSRQVVIRIAIAVASIGSLSALFPRGEAIELDYKVGAVWARKDLIAPFSFPVYRDERDYLRDVEQAKKNAYLVFERRPFSEADHEAAFDSAFAGLRHGIAVWKEYRRNERRSHTAQDSLALLQFMDSLSIPLDRSDWESLSRLASAGRLESLKTLLSELTAEYLRVGILDRRKDTLSRKEIAVRQGTLEQIVRVENLYDMHSLRATLQRELQTEFRDDTVVTGLAEKIALGLVTPNIRFNREATDQAIATAVAAVPRTIGYVQEYERIVSKHDRITPETKLKLESLSRARAERGGDTGTQLSTVGVVLHVTIVLALYGIYLQLFRRKIFQNNRQLALIALLILIEGFFAYITVNMNVAAPVEYLILLPAASMLLTIIFDSRVAFYGTVIMALLVGGIRGNDYSIALASLVAGALAVYTVRDIKNRNQIFRSLGFIFLGYALSIIALGMERFEDVNLVLEQMMFAGANAIISPVLTFGLLIFFERFFRVTTDLTLIELSHFNHPLLRMLSEQAPGTYHHSMTIASLAEAAAVAVGANEVLARVGAYFHDIGKIEKPGYFVENQKGPRNRHDKLSPRMSSLIIAAHVKDGMALGREYSLPEEVVDFIPQHHGTTRIDFFYNKARKLAENSDDETKIDEIKEQDYRYPGPKPQTKETGILMLADAIEATARTLDDPSPSKLEYTIDELIKKRFEEGELDECPLTLKDLTKIKAAFLNVLVGIYHSRIKYPSQEKKKTARPPVAAAAETPHPEERLSQKIKEIDNE
jgi:putative nucleotidyltransferase with HDIG domain